LKIIEIEELQSLVPHKGRMFLLNKINSYDLKEGRLEAECDITEDCLFYDPASGGVPSWLSFEFSAQAISGLFGLRRREMGKKPKIGYIMSVSSLKTEVPFFRPGTTVQIKVKEINRIDTVYSFDSFVFLDGRKLYEGKLTVMDVEENKSIE